MHACTSRHRVPRRRRDGSAKRYAVGDPRTSRAIAAAASPPSCDRPSTTPARSSGGRFWPTFHTVAHAASVRGNQVPDAHLVALMRQNDVPTIFTLDRDFRRFDGIEVKDPLQR